jgi:predicted acyl esterase
MFACRTPVRASNNAALEPERSKMLLPAMQVTNVNTSRRALLVALSSVLICVPSARARDEASATAQDTQRLVQRPTTWSDRSYYLTMRDGVKLAISLYFQNHLEPKVPAPTILIQTRYGRARTKSYADPWLESGFAVVSVDVRGTTASFGSREIELGPEEQADAEEIIAHITHQRWSDGHVIASGFSYAADTSDMATTRHVAGLVVAIPRETDFDFYDLFWPGGIPNDYLFLGWGEGIYQKDFGRGSATRLPPGRNKDAVYDLDCDLRVGDCPKLYPTLQPVDEDSDYRLLREALHSRETVRKHWSVQDYATADFRDDRGANGYPIFSSTAGYYLAAIRREAKPVQYWGSWTDANVADSALNRYNSAPEVPAQVIITANNHAGNVRVDPFTLSADPAVPSLSDQHRISLRFAQQTLRGSVPKRCITYYVLGAETWRRSSTWPPNGVALHNLYLTENGKLTEETPAPGVDSYVVDFSATTGGENRWTTQNGPTPKFRDRRAEDQKLLVYDTRPIAGDMELVGWVTVHLRMRAQTADPALFAYIEDVAPDGTVIYVSEGELRAIHRKVAGQQGLPYDQGPVPHSFYRKDSLPVVPGRTFTAEFKLYSTAALIRKGHRIRLALAGADADTFQRLSPLPDRYDIYRGGTVPSRVTIPLRLWIPEDNLQSPFFGSVPADEASVASPGRDHDMCDEH